MKFLAVGLNHRTAPVSVREHMAVAADQLKDALRDGLAHTAVSEIVILSTCNRTEIFAVAESDSVSSEVLLEWLCEYHSKPTDFVAEAGYRLEDEAAVEHVINVAAGLDSLVLGEPQILGQMKTAFQNAVAAEAVGSCLQALFQHVFKVAKQIRTETGIGENPVSVAYTAVTLSRRLFSKLSNKTAVLIGAGETIELVAEHLAEQGIGKMVVANRSIGRARKLAERFDATAVLLSELSSHLHLGDIVISSTGSQLPVLGKGAVESALKKRRRKPMFMVDIAVPRDIEPEVGQLSDVYLYTVDDLQQVVDENRKVREEEAVKAESIVKAGVEEYQKLQQRRASSNIIVGLRQQAEQVRDAELAKAIQQLERGADPEKVAKQLAHALTNKFMHRPSVAVKQASENQDEQHLEVVKHVFGLTSEN